MRRFQPQPHDKRRKETLGSAAKYRARTHRPRKLLVEYLEDRRLLDGGSPVPVHYYAPLNVRLDAIVRAPDTDLEIVNRTDQTVLASWKLNEVSELVVHGTPLDDHLTVDWHNLTKTVVFHGMTQTSQADDRSLGDTLEVKATDEVLEYVPDKSVSGKGQFHAFEGLTTIKARILFEGVEPVVIHGAAIASYVDRSGQGADLTIDSPQAGRNRISGQSGSVVVSPLTFYDIPSMTVNTTAGGKADRVSLESQIVASELSFFRIDTGGGEDRFRLYATEYSLPGGIAVTSGGAGQVFARGATRTAISAPFTQSGIQFSGINRLEPFVSRPLVLVPGMFRSAAKDQYLGEWLATLGLTPDKLATDPYGDTYKALVTTLEGVGYELGNTLFVADWDWRLPLAPADPLDGFGNLQPDGVLGSLTASSLTDSQFEYGVDYLGVTLKGAAERWRDLFAASPASVDVIGHTEGGLLARAYIQSAAYNQPYAAGRNLPKVHQFVMIGVPNRGETQAWNWLHDNWIVSLDSLLQIPVLNLAYQRVLRGATVTTPQGTLGLVDVTDPVSGQPDAQRFLARYLGSLRDILPTFDFYVDGSVPGDINSDPLWRNHFLLDLNDGLDLLYDDQGLPPQGRDPNRFIDSLTGKLTVIYSEEFATPGQVVAHVGDGASGRVHELEHLAGRVPAAGEEYYQDGKLARSGDQLVLSLSSAAQFNADTARRTANKIKLKKVLATDTGGTRSNQGLASHWTAQGTVLDSLGREYVPANISTSGSADLLTQLYRKARSGISLFVQDPATVADAVTALGGLLEDIGEVVGHYLVAQQTMPNPLEVEAGFVSIVAVDASANELQNDSGQFAVVLGGGQVAPAGGLTVYYEVLPGSTATAGEDYQPLSGSVVIPEGQFVAAIDVTPLQDLPAPVKEPSETVEVRLTGTSDPGIVPEGQYETATVTISDKDVIFAIGDLDLPEIPLPLGKIGIMVGLALSFRDFEFHYDAQDKIVVSGTVGLSCGTLKLAPTSPHIVALARNIGGTLTLASNEVTDFTLFADQLRLQVKDYLRLETTGLEIAPLQDVVLHMDTVTAGIPQLDVYGTLQDLNLTRTGGFSVRGFTATSVQGIFRSLDVASFLPADLTGLALQFHYQDLNDNGIQEPDEPLDLGSFDIEVTGKINPKFFSAWPFEPVIQIGSQSETKLGDEFSFSLSILSDGRVVPKDISNITLGFRRLKIGQVTLGGTISLGGYTDGQFNPDFRAWLRIDGGLDELQGSAEVQITSDFSPDLGTLTVMGNLNVGFTLKDGLVKVENGNLNFGMVVTRNDAPDGSFGVDVAPLPGKAWLLDTVSVSLLQLKFGDYLTFQARNTWLDFNATGNQPLISFGGSPPPLDPRQSYNPNSAPDGSLSAVFGAAAGPLEGWGGVVGNFAIGADLSFQLLNQFFVRLQIGQESQFGLPGWLPVELRSVEVRFNDAAVQDGKLVQPSNFSIIVSGGIKEGQTPLVGEFSGLRVNVGTLVQRGLDGAWDAIENLNGFSVGINDVKIGPVKIGGALSLGMVQVDTNGDGQDERAFYARLKGSFGYSNIGGGIDIAFSQYGPMMATLSIGGIVIPAVGFSFGIENAGFNFGGQPFPSLTKPTELLTNPVFHSPTAITLGEIERRVKNAMIAGVPTWNDGFTLTGTATVSNIYVGGLIKGNVTLAANLDLASEDQGLRLLATGTLEVFGMPIGQAGMLLDMSNPLAPKLDIAAALPSPGNPLAFLYPAQGTFTLSVDTKGLFEAPLVGLGVFFDTLVKNPGGLGDAAVTLFEPSLVRISQRLNEQLWRGEQPALARILLDDNADRTLQAGEWDFDALDANGSGVLEEPELDRDGDGIVSDAERMWPISPQFIKDRVLGTPDGVVPAVPALLVTTFEALDAMFGTELNPIGESVDAPDSADFSDRLLQSVEFVAAFLPELLQETRELDVNGFTDAIASMTPILVDAVRAGVAAGWERFDPSLKLRGMIQPSIFGMPIGEPSAEIELSIDKRAVSFGFKASVTDLIQIMVFGAGAFGVALPEQLKLLRDQTTLAVSLDLPDELITAVIAGKAPDESSLIDMVADVINPFANWQIAFTSEAGIGPFDLGKISGIIFGPQTDSDGQLAPTGLAAQRIVCLDEKNQDGQLIPDDEPDDDLADEVQARQNDGELLIPVSTHTQYVNVMTYGGMLLTGQLSIPKILVDPIDVINDVDWTLPQVDFDWDNPFGSLDTIPTDIEKVKTWIVGIINSLTKNEEWARLQLFVPSPAALFDLGTYLKDENDKYVGVTDINTLSDTALQTTRDILNAAYVDGYSDLVILGTQMGKTRIRGTVSGLEATAEIPWLGLEATFAATTKQTTVNQVFYDVVTSPVVSTLLAGIGNPAETFSFLTEGVLPALPLAYPVAAFEAVFNSNDMVAFFADKLGLPADTVFQLPAHVGVEFGGYTPGYGGPADPSVMRNGGFRIEATASIPSLVENGLFVFEIEPFGFSVLDDPTTFFIPNFKTHAAADHVGLPGLGGDLLSLDDALIDITRSSGTLSAELGGTLRVLGATYAADGHLILDTTLPGPGGNDNGGLYGYLVTTADPGTMMSGAGFTLDGIVEIHVNTTAIERTWTPANHAAITAPAQSGRVYVDGLMQFQAAGVPSYSLDGTFELSVSPAGLDVWLDADAKLGFLGDLDAVGELHVLPAPLGQLPGIYGGLALSSRTLAGPGFSMSGEFQFEVNTTGAPQTITGLVVDPLTGAAARQAVVLAPASLRVVAGGDVQLAGSFDLTGRFELIMAPGRFSVATDASLDAFGQKLSVGGSAVIYGNDSNGPGGLVLHVGLSAPNGFQAGLFKVTGDAQLRVNTSPVNRYDACASPNGPHLIPGNTALVQLTNSRLETLGFTLTGSMSIGFEAGRFQIIVPDSNPLSLDFLGLTTIQFSGYLYDTGAFRLTALASFQWYTDATHWGGVEFAGGFTITNSEDPRFYAHGSATLIVSWIPFTASAWLKLLDNNEIRVGGCLGDLCADFCLGSVAATQLNPVIDSLAIPPAAGEGARVDLAAVARDPNGGPLAYSWTVTKNGAAYAAGAGSTFSFIPDDNGAYEASLTVTKAGGLSATGSGSIAVSNVPPRIDTLTVPAVGVAGTSVPLSAVAVDPGSADQAGLSYAWTVTRNGTWFTSGTGPAYSFVPTAAADLGDVYGVTLAVTDKDAGAATQTKNVLVYGSSILVTSAADNLDGTDTEITLREAIAAAHQLGGNRTIRFASSLAGQFLDAVSVGDTAFGATAYAIGCNLTIDAAGVPGVTIGSATSAKRLFRVAPEASLTLRNVTLYGGVARGGDGGASAYPGGGGAGMGGAILNQGWVEIVNSTLTANLAIGGNGGVPLRSHYQASLYGGAGGGPNGGAAGVHHPNHNAGNGGFGGGGGGGATADPHWFGRGGNGGFGGGGGGGDANGGWPNVPAGTLGLGGFGGGNADARGWINTSATDIYTLAGGGAGMGGAVFNYGGTLKIINSTLSGNQAIGGSGSNYGTNWGGPGSAYGGAVFTYQGQVDIYQSTLAGNQVRSSAVTDGGAVFARGEFGASDNLRLRYSILADSTNGTSPVNDVTASGYSFAAGHYNVVELPAANPGWGGSWGGTWFGTDPQLGPLQNNGGATWTQMPRSGSPAIDSAWWSDNAYQLPGDQRGVPTDGIRDIGAVQYLVHFTVTSAADVVNPSDGLMTLREALGFAATVPGKKSITFAPALAGQAIQLATVGDERLGASALYANTDILIDGAAAPGLTITRDPNAPAMRLFYVDTAGVLTLKNLTLSGGWSQGGDGDDSFHDPGVLLTGGGGGGGGLGGALYNRGIVRLESGTLTDNRAVGGHGGGAVSNDGTGRGGGPNGGIQGGNGGFGGGGGGGNAWGASGGLGGFGGGGGGAETAGSSLFGGGTASTWYAGGGAGLGGAVFNDAGATLMATNTTFSGNAAQGGAGGLKLDQNEIFGGGGAGLGGAVFNRGGTVVLVNSTLADNRVRAGIGMVQNVRGGDGGAVYNLQDGGTARLILANSILADTTGGLDAVNEGGTVEGGANLVESSRGLPGGVVLVTSGPILGALADNGGPTKTDALLPGSPAKSIGQPDFPSVAIQGDPDAYQRAVLKHANQVDRGASVLRGYWRISNDRFVSYEQESDNLFSSYDVEDDLSLFNNPIYYTSGVDRTGAGPLLGEVTARLDGSNSAYAEGAWWYSPTDAVALEAWVRPQADISTYAPIVLRTHDFTLEDGYGLYHADRSRVVFFVQTSSAWQYVTVGVPLEQWSHLVGTFDGTSLRLYVNGTLQASTSFDATTIRYANVADKLLIGTTPGNYDAFKGQLDEVAVYGVALSAADVAAHYTAGHSPVAPPADARGGTRHAGYLDLGAYQSDTPVARPGGPYTGAEGALLTLSGSGSTPSGTGASIVQYDWDLNYDGTFQPDLTSTQPTVTHSFPNDFPTRTIALRITDSSGRSDLRTTALTVTNLAPTITALTLPDTGIEGTPLTATIQAADPGVNDVLSYRWELWYGGQNIENVSGGTSYTFTPQNDGVYSLYGVISDEHGFVDWRVRTVTVANAEPTILQLMVPKTGVEGAAITVSMQATDPGIHDPLNYRWEVHWGGAPVELSPFRTEPSYTFTPPEQGTYWFRAVVWDGQGGGVADWRAVEVANLPPRIDSLSVPASGVEGSPLTVSATASDPGATDTVSLAWTVQKAGVEVASGSGPSLSFTPADSGNYVVRLTASDGDGGMATRQASIAVANVAPVVSVPTATFGSQGLWPNTMLAADVNSDGLPDLITGNSHSNSVSVMLSDGAGRFQPVLTFEVAGPTALAAADFNADGRIDLAVGTGAGTVVLFCGDGAGHFESHSTLSRGAGFGPVTSLLAQHFDGDGYADLAVTNDFSATVAVFMAGVLAGVFPSGGDYPVALTAGDFNGDGALDLAAANSISCTIGVLLRDAAQGFVLHSTFSTNGSTPVSLVAGNLNADSRTDLAVANFNSNTVGVFFGQQDGSFGGGVNYATGGVGPRSVQLADLNRDGNHDLIVANLYSAGAAVLLRDGPTGLAAPRNYPTGGAWPAALAIADFNSDGWPDLATAHLDNNAVGLLVGDGAGSLRPHLPLDESAAVLVWNASFGDPGADAWTATVDYGDGSGVQPLALAGDKTFQLNHTYTASGHYLVTIRVTDDDGGVGTQELAVTVRNVPPAIAALADAVVDEGETFRQTVTFADPGADRWTARVDYGDGSPVQTLSLGTLRSFTLNHAYADPGSYVVSFTAMDDDGGTGQESLTVTVRNLPPTIAQWNGPVTGVEGTPITVNVQASDPAGSSLPLQYSWNLVYQGASVGTGHAATFTLTPPDDGEYWLHVTVSDGHGGQTVQSQQLQVVNVAPAISLSGSASAAEGSPYLLTIGPPVDPGQDTVTAYSIDWGDGTVQVFDVAADGGPAGAYTHIYADGPDQCTIRVSLTDEDGTYAEAGYHLASTSLATVAASPFTGDVAVRPGYPSPPGAMRPFDNADNLAWVGHGAARPAVAKNTLGGLHQAAYANDGFYGNGSSWISTSGDNWVKIDLGRTVWIDTLQFGRDRLGTYDDRDPGRFTISVALADNVYAHGDDSGDAQEYVPVFDSGEAGAGTAITGPETVQARFAAVLARFVKLLVANPGTVIDEIEVQAAGSLTLAVTNVPPTITAYTLPATGVQGSPVLATVAATDPGLDDALQYRWELWWGGSIIDNVMGGTSYTFTPHEQGDYLLYVVVNDSQGALAWQSLTIAVTNAPPTATIGNSGPVNEGSPVTVSLSNPSDPSSVDAAAGFHYSYATSVAGLATTYAGAADGPSQSFTFPDNGTPTVYARIFDKNDGFTDYSTAITVNNVAPTATIGNSGPVNEGSPVTVSLSNPSDPSSVDAAAGFHYSYATSVAGLATTYAGATDGTSKPFTFTDNGTPTVYARIFDKDGGYSDYSTVVTVHNVAPTATIGNSGPVNEGSPVTVSLSNPSDPSSVDAAAGFHYSYATSVAGLATTYAGATDGTSKAFTFTDNGTPTVYARIFDKDGGYSDYSTVVTVHNVSPTATIGNSGPVNEGSPVTVSLSNPSDPSSADTAAGFHYSYATSVAGLATTYAGATDGTSKPFTFTDNGTPTVYARIFDKDGGYSDYSTAITVNNVAPTATIGNSGPVNEGSPVTVSLSNPSDPSSVDAAAGFHYSYATSVAGLAATYAGATDGTSKAFTFPDNGTPTVYARIFDKNDGFTDYSTAITVNNVAPTATIGNSGPVNEGSPVTVSLSNPSDPSSADTAAGFHYSYATSVAGLATTYAGATDGTSKAFTFTDNGTPTVYARIFDKDGGYSDHSTAITVNNVAPTAKIGNSGPVNEGSPVTVSLSNPSDPSSADTAAGFHYSYATSVAGLATTYAGATDGTSKAFTFTDNGTPTVYARIFDKDGGFTDYSTAITVNNVAPTATIGNSGPVNEGSPVTISLSNPSDPSSADTAAGFHYSYATSVAGLAATYAGATDGTSKAFTFPDNGTPTVYARIFDKNDGFTDYSTAITVNNVAPTATIGNSGPVNEGSPVTVSLSNPSDPSSVDAAAGFHYSYATSVAGLAATYAGATDGTSKPFTFTDNGTPTVYARIFDKDGGFTDYSTAITANNVAPTATIGNAGPVHEGSPVTVSLSNPSDPSSADTAAGFHYSYATSVAGLATTYAGATDGTSKAFTFPDNGTPTVYARIFDKNDGFTDYSTAITVNNVAPTATIGNSGPVSEGSPVTVSLSNPSDPSSVDAAAGFHYSYATSVAGLAATYAGATDGTSKAFTFPDNGTPTVYARIFDKDGGYTDYSTLVTVNNVPPSNLQLHLSAAEISESGGISLSGNFTDPGTLDTHRVTIDWGDGGPADTLDLSAGIVSWPEIAHVFRVHRPYNESYTIRVTVADEVDSATATTSTVWPWFDFGDAPDSYHTLLTSNGARHRFGAGLFLGAKVDEDGDGRPTSDALGDDTRGGDDEDGVTFGPILRQGRTATVRVTASQAGRLDAFLDFNADGDFADAGEKIFDNVAVAAGDNDLTFLVPGDAVSAVTYARFRLSSAGGLDFDGLAGDGEVEDYRVTVGLHSVWTLVADGRYRADVYNATPGSVVTFVYGTQTGVWPLPQFGVTLGITNPTFFALGGTTDAAGHTAAVLNIPSSLSGQTLYVQAFEQVPTPQTASIFIIDRTPPTVTVNRASDQPKRTSEAPLHFTVTFSKPVIGFTAEDVTLSGTAPESLIVGVTQDGTTYEVAVSGMAGTGTVIVSVAAGVAHDGEGNPNSAANGQDSYVVFLSNPWQNYPQACDVSGDDTVTPWDVLLVINWLNTHDAGRLPSVPAVNPVYLDVDGNGIMTPLDALLVINWLNANLPSQAGEGESVNDAGRLPTCEWAPWNERMNLVPATGPTRPSDMAGGSARPATLRYAPARPISLAESEWGFVGLDHRDDDGDSVHGRAWQGLSVAEADLALIELDDILSDLAEDVLHSGKRGLRSD
jgi:hypothetical protein